MLVQHIAWWHDLCALPRTLGFHAPMQFGSIRALPGCGCLPGNFLPGMSDVVIDLSPIFQVKRQTLVNKRKRQRGEVIRNHFRRIMIIVELYDVPQTDSMAH